MKRKQSPKSVTSKTQHNETLKGKIIMTECQPSMAKPNLKKGRTFPLTRFVYFWEHRAPLINSWNFECPKVGHRKVVVKVPGS